MLQAVGLILVGMLSSALRPLIGSIPLNAVFLTAASILIGRAILRSQIFNPLAELNARLAAKNQQLTETNGLKTQFLSKFSYELRTPLSSVIGYSGLILDEMYGPINTRQRDRLEKVTRNGQHLLSLINDILDLNRIEAGNMQLNRERVTVQRLVDTVCTVVDPMALDKALALVGDLSAGLPDLLVDSSGPVRFCSISFPMRSNSPMREPSHCGHAPLATLCALKCRIPGSVLRGNMPRPSSRNFVRSMERQRAPVPAPDWD